MRFHLLVRYSQRRKFDTGLAVSTGFSEGVAVITGFAVNLQVITTYWGTLFFITVKARFYLADVVTTVVDF